MWWMSIFGSLRYAWLRQTLLRNKNARISPDELIDPLFYVIDTWNPTDDLSDVLYCVDLYHYEVYSPGMVCKVLMDAINVTNFDIIQPSKIIIWTIVKIMITYRITDPKLRILYPLYKETEEHLYIFLDRISKHMLLICRDNFHISIGTTFSGYSKKNSLTGWKNVRENNSKN